MAKKNTAEEFNPIKEVSAGLKVTAVKWSSRVLQKAKDAIKKGMPLKANPFLNNDIQLLKPDLVFERTAEEIEIYRRCMNDVVYFASFCYLMTPAGLKKCELRDYLVSYLQHLQKHNFSIFLSCRQSGKCFTLFSILTIKLNFSDLSYFKQNLLANLLKRYEYIKDQEGYIIILPAYELFHLFLEKSLISNIKYKLYKFVNEHSQTRKFITKCIGILDKFDYNVVCRRKLTDNYKTIREHDVLGKIQIKTDTGFLPISQLYLSKPFEIWKITLENGYSLECADEHRVFGRNFEDIFVNTLQIGDFILTDEGPKMVTKILKSSLKVCMGDLMVDDINHRFYTNGILSHNSTTTAIECLWQIIFNYDYKGLILSKSGAAGRDLIKKIKDMYRYLPDFLKPGIYKWNVSEMAFDNNSGVYTEAFSDTAGLGNTINFLILDEFAWCPASQVELFYNNVIPTVTTMPDAKVRIMSTQNGHNFFYQLWQLATVGDPKTGKKSGYGTFKVDWWQVPLFNKKTQQWEKRTELWKQMMIGRLGTEENFDYQYGTNFYSSDKCILSRQRIAKLHEGEKVYEPWFGIEADSQTSEEILEEALKPFIEALATGNIEGVQNAINNFIEETTQNRLLGLPEQEEQLEEESKETAFEQLLFLEREQDWEYDYFNDWIVILCDLAEGSGGDFTVFQILQWDGKKLVQRARWRSNTVILDEAAFVLFWLCAKVFNQQHLIVSIEWNTYGAYFYKCLIGCLDVFPNIDFDTGIIVWYPKTQEDLASYKGFNKKIPGQRFTATSKKTSCMLIKNEFERELLEINDMVTISEIENFEQQGNSYAAVRGHDDTVMPLILIPKLKETAKWIEFTEEFTEFQLVTISGAPSFDPYESMMSEYSIQNPMMLSSDPREQDRYATMQRLQ